MSTGDGTLTQPRFQKGDGVRVKAGVRHFDYPDLPIGGWVGSIVELDDDDEGNVYRVHWTVETIRNMPTLYLERCDRDGFEACSMWLSEYEIEADDGRPATLEATTFPEWAQHAGDEQLAVIFDLGKDDSIPDADREALAAYRAFLIAHLSLPFEAAFEQAFDPEYDDPKYLFKVLELLPPTDETADAGDGLLCLVDVREEIAEAEPLVGLFVDKHHPNYELLADYRHWINGGPGDDDWDDEDDQEDEVGNDDDDEYGPNSVYGRMFKATMAGLRSGHDILGELPGSEAREKARFVAEDLILSDVEPESENVADEEEPYDEAPQPLRKSGPQVGRNDPCPCGSGKKYKKCCMKRTCPFWKTGCRRTGSAACRAHFWRLRQWAGDSSTDGGRSEKPGMIDVDVSCCWVPGWPDGPEANGRKGSSRPSSSASFPPPRWRG